MVVGPLLAVVAIVVIGMGVLNIVIGHFNNPRKGQSSG